ncbi:MAG: hypothetical protein SFU98_21635 [Leptospiraceae bacterium]|nr:hypothetical protein [Leptospiraceae bacterium]
MKITNERKVVFRDVVPTKKEDKEFKKLIKEIEEDMKHPERFKFKIVKSKKKKAN